MPVQFTHLCSAVDSLIKKVLDYIYFHIVVFTWSLLQFILLTTQLMWSCQISRFPVTEMSPWCIYSVVCGTKLAETESLDGWEWFVFGSFCHSHILCQRLNFREQMWKCLVHRQYLRTVFARLSNFSICEYEFWVHLTKKTKKINDTPPLELVTWSPPQHHHRINALPCDSTTYCSDNLFWFYLLFYVLSQ